MTFGTVAVADGLGAVLAHTLRAGDRVLKKGHVLDARDLADLAAAGFHEIVVARLDDGDLGENAAAAMIAAPLAGAGVRVDPAHTGRANLFAEVGGLVEVDLEAVARINAIDEAITVATVAAGAPVAAGAMVGTVKIIPFAVAAAAAAQARDAAGAGIAMRPWRPRRAGLVLTRTGGTAESVLDRAAAAQRARLERCGSALVREQRVPHTTEAVTAALAAMAADGLDLVLALGASAIMDRRDVIPAALERAGGAIERLGMPVDPGNLLLLGRLGAVDVIGVPGCARSTRRSGFDWVLERICAGLPVAGTDLARLGVGGLLDEIESRPAPRRGGPAADD